MILEADRPIVVIALGGAVSALTVPASNSGWAAQKKDENSPDRRSRGSIEHPHRLDSLSGPAHIKLPEMTRLP